MKRFLLVLLLIGAPVVRGADNPSVTFYVQLICGSDADGPPTSEARLVGPKLDQRLHDVFRWKNYWEVKRETIELKTGAKARRHMSAQRDIELAWPAGKDMTVSIYTNGKLTRRRQQTIDAAFYIAGGDRNGSESWFIIVRRDNPDDTQGVGAKLAAMP